MVIALLGKSLRISAMQKILQSCKLSHKVNIKCTMWNTHPTRRYHSFSFSLTSLDDMKVKFNGCLEGFWKVPDGCLQGNKRVLEGIKRVSEGSKEGVWRVQRGCLENVKIWFSSGQAQVKTGHVRIGKGREDRVKIEQVRVVKAI